MPLLLVALWQLAALAWGLYAYLAEPPDPPLPSDPPAFAGWFQAIRDDVPPDDRLEVALREIRNTVVVVPPLRSAAPDQHPADDHPRAEVSSFAGHVPDPLAGLDPDALWRLYDHEDDIRVRIDLLARLGSAYGGAGEGHAADTCRLAGVWMAHEQPAQRRYLLRVLGCSGQMYDYVQSEPLAFPARRLLAELDRAAYRAGRLDRQLQREAAEHTLLRESGLLHRPYPPTCGESWHDYGEALVVHGARRAARSEYRLELEAIRKRKSTTSPDDYVRHNEQVARVELAQLHWEARQYPQAYGVVSGLPLSESFEGSGLSCSYRWAAKTFRLVYGSACLSGPAPLLHCLVLRPRPLLEPLLIAAFFAGVGIWWLRRLFRDRWTPVTKPGRDEAGESGPEGLPRRYRYHDARWGPLLWCHLAPLAVMLVGVWGWYRWADSFGFSVLFAVVLSGWATGCVWLWPLWLGPRDNQIELSRDGVATSTAFVRWEKIRWLEAEPGGFTAVLRLGQWGKPFGLIHGSLASVPLAHPALETFLADVRRLRPDLPCVGVEEMLARLRRDRDRMSWKGVVPLLLLAAGFGLLLMISPLSLLSGYVLPRSLPLTLETAILVLMGISLFLFALSLAMLLVQVRPFSRAGRWLVGTCQVTFVISLYTFLLLLLFPEVPRWIPTSLYTIGLLLPLAVLLLLRRPEPRSRSLEIAVVALLLLIPAMSCLLDRQDRQRTEETFTAVRLTEPLSTGPALIQIFDWHDRKLVAGRFDPAPEAWVIDPVAWTLERSLPLTLTGWARLDREGRLLLQGGPLVSVRLEDRPEGFRRMAPVAVDLETGNRHVLPTSPTAKPLGPHFLSCDRTRVAWLEQDQDGYRVRRLDLETGQDVGDPLPLPHETDWGKHLLRDGTGWLPDGTLMITAKLIQEPPPTPDNPMPYRSGPYRLIRWLLSRDGTHEVLTTTRTSHDWGFLPDVRHVLRHTGRPIGPGYELRYSVVDAFGTDEAELTTRRSDFRLVTRPDVPWLYQVLPDGYSGQRLVADDWTTGEQVVSVALPMTSKYARLDAVSTDGRWAVVVDAPLGLPPVRLVEIPTGRVTPLRIWNAGRPVTLRWYDYEPEGSRRFSPDSRYLVLPAWDDIEGRQPTLYRIELPEAMSSTR